MVCLGALDYYERALALLTANNESVTEEEKKSTVATLQLNMAATLMGLKRFHEAHEAAGMALKGGGADKIKAFFRFVCIFFHNLLNVERGEKNSQN